MTRSEFLGALEERLIAECDAELRLAGRTARDCPYILDSIEHYAHAPLWMLMTIVQRFGRAPAGSDARGLIDAVVGKARAAAKRLAGTNASAPPLQASALHEDGRTAPVRSDAVTSRLGAGRALEGPIANRMGMMFGADFSGITIHDDAAAEQLNRSLGSHAFTIGKQIAFGAGEYRPGTPAGDRLLAHELTHTLQQGSSPSPNAAGPEDRGLEDEADRIGSAAVSGADVSTLLQVRPGIPSPLQRDPVDDTLIAVALTAALTTGEVTTDVVVTDTVVTAVAADATTDVAASTLPDLILDSAPELTSDLAPDLATDVANDVVADTAPQEMTQAASTSSSMSTVTTATLATVAATTLSGDTATTEPDEDQDPRRRCFETYPTALACDEIPIDRDEAVVEFLLRNGFSYEDLGDCQGFSSFSSGEIDACDGAPGEVWHCDVRGSDRPVSIFGCLCCDAEGATSFTWQAPHWSIPYSTLR